MNRSLNITFLAPFLLLALITACVTVNIYFPAAAAEQAADEIIEGIQGEPSHEEESIPESSQLEPEAHLHQPLQILMHWGLMAAGISPAHAAANLSIDTPEIRTVRARMTGRFNQLAPAYNQGQIGILANGLVAVKNANAVPLKDRNRLNQLVAAENKDRQALYAAIANANGHPEWVSSIQSTFAQRWVSNARPGWWYQSGGAWQQK